MQQWDYKTVVLTGGFMGRHKEELDRAAFERHLDQLGRGLHLLEQAIMDGDERRLQEFSGEELWEFAKVQGSHDSEFEMSLQVAREVGLALINPFSDQIDGLDEDLLLVFPEFENAPEAPLQERP